ncbi:hypothetical protein F5Y04DRAFT_256517 [Hypomontagnella monticulosa]|nr:hypothetical protein F5Y04DRAFT_256517 [Hypomontagnella monticulosa]
MNFFFLVYFQTHISAVATENASSCLDVTVVPERAFRTPDYREKTITKKQRGKIFAVFPSCRRSLCKFYYQRALNSFSLTYQGRAPSYVCIMGIV